MKRLIKASNFTQQTNALDVDKHMLVGPFSPPRRVLLDSG
jgi:hypothetical protein